MIQFLYSEENVGHNNFQTILSDNIKAGWYLTIAHYAMVT